MDSELKLLLLEDNPADAELIQFLLKRSGMQFDATVASDEKEFLKAMDEKNFDAVLADNALPQYSSIEALKLIRKKDPGIAFILVTGTVSEEFAVSIIQQGADDYILKTNLTRLSPAINKAVEKKRIQKEMETAEKNIEKEKELSDSIINSMPAIFYLCNANGKFLRCNKNFEKISGYTWEEINEMMSENFFEYARKEDGKNWVEKVLDRKQMETEALFITKRGEKIPYYFTCSAIHFNDQNCIIGVGMDISARKRTEKELQQLNMALRRLSAHIQNVREEEQTRIAREIHDELGQQITGLKMDVSWLKKKIASNTEPLAIGEKLSSMNDLLDKTIQTIRKIASELRPSILDEIGLYAALEWQGREFEKRSQIPVQFTSTEKELELSPAVATGLFRIFQESLTNIGRHAEAKTIVASLEKVSNELVLTVTDDGKGFISDKQRKTMGLLGMHERALSIGGKLEILSELGEGTTIRITVTPQGKQESL